MKFMIYLCMTVGGVVGSYLPVVLFHVDMFSLWSILLGAVGSLVGLWAGYKIGQTIE